MANELNIQAILTAQRYSPAMQGSGNLNINQTATLSVCNIQSLTTGTGQSLNIGSIGTSQAGYLFVKNLDQTNNAQLTLDSANSNVFAVLKPNEFCLVPVSNLTVYGKASASTVSVLVVAAQA